MSLPVLICDDSSFARKQMARALPEDWQVNINFAENGEKALDAIKAGLGDVLFLDLNMPVLDGFGVLEQIQKQSLNTLVIVVSADVQKSTREKVRQLGALDFIKKPVDKDAAATVFDKFGLLEELQSKNSSLNLSRELLDQYQELTNVAMGLAGEQLGRFLDTPVTLSIPEVKTISSSKLHKRLLHTDSCQESAAVVQGFIGAGIAGESWLFFNNSDFKLLSELMHVEEEVGEELENELSVSISNILIGACLKSIGLQLEISFSEGYATLLGRHFQINEVFDAQNQSQEILEIDISFALKEHDVNWTLILLFTEDSIPKLNEKINCLI